MLEIFAMTQGHELWNDTITFAENCSWKAGPYLAQLMKENKFLEWERVFVACEDGKVVGYCTLTAKDELPDTYDFTPLIGFVFVDEKCRGKRISEQMINSVVDYAGGLGYDTIYIMSGEQGLYEKYGFEKIGEYRTIYDSVDQLFKRSTVMNMKIIETERMILRPLTTDDAQDVFEWAGDPVVNRYMPYPLHENVQQAKEWISTLGDKNEFGFCLKETGKVIGAGSITYRAECDAYELGYNLNRKFWGMGYATEASKALIQWAYENIDARDFLARHANANKASGNVITKCGFQFERYGQYSRYDGSEVFEASYYRLHLE